MAVQCKMEREMKTILRLAVTLVLTTAFIAPAAASRICLTTYLIDQTKAIDSKTLDFRMKNGTVYRNALRNQCIGLKFHGFVYVTHFDTICENMQTIRVLESGEVCMLGAFTKLPPSAKI